MEDRAMNDTERAALVEELARAITIIKNTKPYDIDTDMMREFHQYQAETHLLPIIDRLLAGEYQKGYSQRFDDEKRFATRPEAAADAVERAAKAIHQMEDQPRAIPWGALSEGTRDYYHKKARAALQAAAVEPEIDVDGIAVAVQGGLNEYTRSLIVEQDGESYIKGYEPAGELEAIRKAIATAMRKAAAVEPETGDG